MLGVFLLPQKFIAVGKGAFDLTLHATLAYALPPSVDGENMDLCFAASHQREHYAFKVHHVSIK